MTESIQKKPLKKGSLVVLDREKYRNSVESLASDIELPNYVFEGPGEILAIKEDYAQVRWRRPVPDVWFKLEQLQEYTNEEI
tara:strand:- start:162 stop:407 length:246 start_codon:yes stop_codon:yes gene_type:complete